MAPNEFQGSVIGGINKRSGIIQNTDMSDDGSGCVVQADVPLAQVKSIRIMSRRCDHASVVHSASVGLSRSGGGVAFLRVDTKSDLCRGISGASASKVLFQHLRLAEDSHVTSSWYIVTRNTFQASSLSFV